MARDLSSAPVLRAIFETACCGIRLQIWRRTLNLDRVGLIACFFIPALWQGYTVEPTLFLSALWDGCGLLLNLRRTAVKPVIKDGLKLNCLEFGGPGKPHLPSLNKRLFSQKRLEGG